MIISLTGFMGCGKSSVGRKLSELLCCSFMDLDDVIVENAGKSIPEIFATDGETAFRKMEREVLRDIITSAGRHSVPEAPSHLSMGPSPYPVNTPKIDRFPGTPGVGKCQFRTYASQPLENTTIILALGGGAVMQAECEKTVHESTVCIYLKASVDTLLRHLEGQAAGRPLLNTPVDTDFALEKRILDLIAKRATTYERTAHHIIDTDNKTIEEIAAEICCILNCQA